ncbi:MAG: hypothetical protein AB7P24_02905 [Nitrospira sp.]
MNQPIDGLIDDLQSRDPMRVQRAIKLLRDRMKKGYRSSIAPFGNEVLDAFSGSVPEATVLDFLEIIEGYAWFEPPLSMHQKVAKMVALVLRDANPYIALEVALTLRTMDKFGQACTIAFEEMLRHGLRSPTALMGAKYLVSRLLDTTYEKRRPMLEQLCTWPREEPYSSIIDYITPQLNQEELARILRPGSGD